MARRGLPKSYIKKYGVTKKAWAEYRKSKGGSTRKKAVVRKKKSTTRKPATRRTTVSRKTAPRKVARRKSIRRAVRPTMDKTMQAGLKVGTGVGGAVLSAMLIKMLPIDKRMQALSQLGTGVLITMMVPKKRRIIRFAGYGTSLAGALALLKSTFPQIPLLAGNAPMSLNRRYGNRNVAPTGQQVVTRTGNIDTTYAPMGENKDFGLGENTDFALSGAYGSYSNAFYNA